uniref:Uncharacterized protein n=1 Tax=Anguilla anguilla TaxID=7936 RepID=A0A0E9UZW9_ANGAN
MLVSEDRVPLSLTLQHFIMKRTIFEKSILEYKPS